MDDATILMASKALLVPFLSNQSALNGCQEYLVMEFVLVVNTVLK